MLRLIVLVVLVVLAVWLIRRALARSNRKSEPSRAASSPGELVKCAHCGLHLPRAEARETLGLLYCSEEHARLGRR